MRILYKISSPKNLKVTISHWKKKKKSHLSIHKYYLYMCLPNPLRKKKKDFTQFSIIHKNQWTKKL